MEKNETNVNEMNEMEGTHIKEAEQLIDRINRIVYESDGKCGAILLFSEATGNGKCQNIVSITGASMFIGDMMRNFKEQSPEIFKFGEISEHMAHLKRTVESLSGVQDNDGCNESCGSEHED